ncbi:MAG: endonuclease Q family protein [Patescibacteria group bacterium]|nr:endonuclease Q family protein [Patescibacteria group bacterium]
MRQIADFHIHSKYSRACSKHLTLANIDKTCRIKGVNIIGTGDFTYPDWIKNIQNELEEIGNSGLYKHKQSNDDKVKFILTVEVALIYKKFDKCRRVHIVAHAPNIEAVAGFNKRLDKNYNIRSDGRPILGMSIEDFCRLCFSVHPKFLIYPAHIWTPWFAIFGSKSGFDNWEDAFGEYSDKIFAYETGLSSDPEMNWRLSALDKLTFLSNSDAHSLPNIAREANVFEMDSVSYDAIYNIIKNKKINSKNYLDYTIEFYPEEGMYHYDGHRACNISFAPKETKKHKGICPKCKKPLVIGVDYQVEELADRKVGRKPKGSPGFIKLIELDKIIAQALGIKSRSAKKVLAEYNNLISRAGTEMEILLDKPLDELKNVTTKRIIEGIRRVRAGELTVIPGYDGEYGKIEIFKNKQKKMF